MIMILPMRVLAQFPSPLPSASEEALPDDPEFDFQYGKLELVPPDASKTFFKRQLKDRNFGASWQCNGSWTSSVSGSF